MAQVTTLLTRAGYAAKVSIHHSVFNNEIHTTGDSSPRTLK